VFPLAAPTGSWRVGLIQVLGPTIVSTRSDAFDEALRLIAARVLAGHGFKFDGNRTFRRLSADQRVSELVNFQLGQRSLAGKFTVNLGVYVDGDISGVNVAQAKEHHCPHGRRMRIGHLIPAKLPVLAKLPYIGFLFGPRDKWWPCSGDPAQLGAALSAVVDKIVLYGLPWQKASGP
jgi:hypothetical protein